MRRLLEYEQMKQAAQALDALPLVGRDFLAISVWIEKTVERRLPDVTRATWARPGATCCTARA